MNGLITRIQQFLNEDKLPYPKKLPARMANFMRAARQGTNVNNWPTSAWSKAEDLGYVTTSYPMAKITPEGEAALISANIADKGKIGLYTQRYSKNFWIPLTKENWKIIEKNLKHFKRTQYGDFILQDNSGDLQELRDLLLSLQGH